MPEKRLLHSGFLDAAASFPNRPALTVAGETLTYAELWRRAGELASAISDVEIDEDPQLTAVFAYRSVTAFAGVLGVLLRGHGYVPLNCTFPPDRTRTMLQRSGSRVVIVDRRSSRQLNEVIEGLSNGMVFLMPDQTETKEMSARWPMHRFVSRDQMAGDRQRSAKPSPPSSPAYVLFTSGSTGVPKGVVVTHSNARHYVDFISSRFSVTEEDRFSQMFDMTFDLSVADMFVAWSHGACVCCPSEKTLLNPGSFINQAGITIWFSVPSTAIFMKRLGNLKPAKYSGLRVSMFCGEALPVDVVRAWAEAAPNSLIENLYGPTELTIACTYYRWDAERSPALSEMGLVPIGDPFPGMVPLVVDERLQEVGPGETGELLMAGPQVSPGYWRDPDRTATAFVVPPNRTELYYRTGDRVRRPVGSRPMTYLGRIDNQIKILGHRVELAEIEAVVRQESGIDAVVALGWPLTLSGASGVEVFLQDDGAVNPDLKERLAARLPSYMVPKRLHLLSTLPLNANGKYDRNALTRYLEMRNDPA